MDRCNKIISEKVMRLLKGYESGPEKYQVTEKVMNPDLTFNWEHIAVIFKDTPLNCPLTYEFCIAHIGKIREISKAADAVLRKSNPMLFRNFFNWTGISNKVFEDVTSRNFEHKVLNLLITTSVFENALGNIYFTITKKRPPHLLRDLLSTDEIINFFGKIQVFFLRMIIGTPNSVNIRNIVWHGFPTNDDIPDYYLSAILITMFSFGKYVQNTGLEVTTRPRIRDLSKLENILPNFRLLEIAEYQKVVVATRFPSEGMTYLWNEIFNYIGNIESHWKALYLILPQIELLLRLLYGDINGCNVSATLDEYYITLDTIFETNPLNHSENKLVKIFNDHLGLFEAMYDIFIAPNGPRLRDKLSHGEIDISNCNCTSTLYKLLEISRALMLVINASNISDIYLQEYRSIYHLNSICWSKLSNVATSLTELEQEEIPKELISELNMPKSRSNCKILHVRIFGCSKDEIEIVKKIIQICNKTQEYCYNLKQSIHNSILQLENKKMRSRSRATFMRLIEMLPTILEVTHNLIADLSDIFINLQENCSYYSAILEKVTRYLQRIIKFSENMLQYVKSNEWIKIRSSTENLKQLPFPK